MPAVAGWRYVVHLQIVDYHGATDRATAARQALAPLGWVDPEGVTIDEGGRAVIIAVRDAMINVRAARTALHDAGFIVGGTSIRPWR